MSQDLLFQLMKQADARLPQSQLRLIAHLVDRVRHCDLTPKPRRNWTELRGIAPNLPGGIDAQEYVSRLPARESFPNWKLKPGRNSEHSRKSGGCDAPVSGQVTSHLLC
jgi:hypothetical protein